MTAKLDDHNLLRCEIREAIGSAWIASGVEVDHDEPISGQVTLDIGGQQWVGTVRGEVGVYGSRVMATVIGGAGGLGVQVDAKDYGAGPSIQVIVDDLLRASGETLSADADQTILSSVLPRFQRRRGTVAQALNDIVRKFEGSAWRILRDGTLWLGVPAYTEREIADGDVVEDEDPSLAQLTIATGAPVYRPGDSVSGSPVAMVVTSLDGHTVRQRVTQAGVSVAGARDARVQAMISDAVDYSRLYSAEVLSQSGGAVDVMPDDVRVRGNGITEVPLRHGIPGLTVQVVTGSRVMVGFENADPSKPFAALWPDGSSVQGATFSPQQKLTIGTGRSPLVVDDLLGTYIDTLFTAVDTVAKAIVPASDGGKAGMTALAEALKAIPRNVAATNLDAD